MAVNLSDYQKKYKTPEEHYHLADGGKTLTAFQTAFEALILRALNRNLLTKVMGEMVKDTSKTLHEHISVKLRDGNSIFGRLYNKSKSEIYPFVADLQKGFDELRELYKVGLNEEGKMDSMQSMYFNENLVTFCQNDLFYKGNIKTPEDLLNRKELEIYNEDYLKLVQGFKYEYGGKAHYQLGWNEARKLIKERLGEIDDALEVSADELHKNKNILENLKPGHEAFDAADKEHTEWSKKFEDLSLEKEDFLVLKNSYEHFRNDLSPFDKSQWDVLLKYVKDKDLEEYEGKVVMPPEQVLSASPFVALANSLGVSAEGEVDFKMISAGIKSYESFVRKILDHADSSFVYDLIRGTLGVRTLKGLNRLFDNIEKECENSNLPAKIGRKMKIYDSGLCAFQSNIGITIGDETIVGEFKVAGLRQMEVKPVCDLIYDIRRVMKPDIGGKENFINLNNEENIPLVNSIKKSVTSLLDSTILFNGEKHKMKDMADQFGIDLSKELVQFESKGNFEKAHTKLTQLELNMFCLALKHEHSSIKKKAFEIFTSATLGQKVEATGKYENQRFKDDDSKKIFLSSFNADEIKDCIDKLRDPDLVKQANELLSPSPKIELAKKITKKGKSAGYTDLFNEEARKKTEEGLERGASLQ